MKKNLFVMLLCLALLMTAWSCAAADAGTAGEGSAVVSINYGGSDIYTQEDMDAALDAIMDVFSGWEGCEMHMLIYAGDTQSLDELDYINSLERGVFDECIIFDSFFRSPKEAYGAWEADTEYAFNWYLGRADKGEWQPVTWGPTLSYYKSERYTDEEMASAMDLINGKLAEMVEVKARYLKYAGDDPSMEQLEYVNSLEQGTFDECAVFTSYFRSPRHIYGAWEPNTEYSWSWYLARADKGDWQVVTFGY